MEISGINSGSTFYKAVPRGRTTFVPVLEYDRTRVAEITVPHRVSHLLDVLESAGIIDAAGSYTRVW